MKRREFLQSAAAIASSAAVDGHSKAIDASSRFASTTLEKERARLANLAECRRVIRKCLRKHLITDYLPGQVCYNLGEYPWRKPWNPGAWDDDQLAELSRAGVQLVQVHDEWNDALRLYGGDKFSPANRPGFRRYETEKQQWIAQHPKATGAEYVEAMREIASRCRI